MYMAQGSYRHVGSSLYTMAEVTAQVLPWYSEGAWVHLLEAENPA